jgi:hypothetical protein
MTATRVNWGDYLHRYMGMIAYGLVPDHKCFQSTASHSLQVGMIAYLGQKHSVQRYLKFHYVLLQIHHQRRTQLRRDLECLNIPSA